MRWLRDFRQAALAVAPGCLALAVAAAGIMLLFSGATPSDPSRFLWLARHTPMLLIEISHFLSSIIGLVLAMVAFGLSRRLDAAWAASVLLLPLAAVLALTKGFDWEESAILVGVLLCLLPFREAFPRAARLTRMEITPGWMLSALAALAGAAIVGWWSFKNVDYGRKTFLGAIFDPDADAERAIRSSAAAAVLLLGVGIWRMVATPATPRVVGEDDPDFSRVRSILERAEVAEPGSNLALLGDKRFLFSDSGASFLMFGVRGRSWIAMGAPVGRREERLELLWRFRELADAHAARPGIYGVGPDDLPDLVELGFAIQKMGESAIVSIDSFSLEGRRRGNLRRSWRKAAESGAMFEVLPPHPPPPLTEALREVSDAWLARHAGDEKSFSLGGFEPAYVAEFPVAVVKVEGRIVAFATLWTTARRTAFSIDLMRYSDDAPKDVMDFLFVELLLWGRRQGYVAFEFGMAPLAGLEDRPLAPIMSRVGRLLFERGEEIYNFRGVRRYKDKYDPAWQPRYIAAARKWAIPMLLADVGLLSSGGVSGLARRSGKSDERTGESRKAA
ncbi:MAG: bifunctional lysylphosphatidylglycerol flippase/synthetase MprF [Caulobacteraceae bacterium]|nr:bifunctional lysylphosphatidylglycerol flippase/synthetase MprF [Caulobacteraceae bacterium]